VIERALSSLEATLQSSAIEIQLRPSITAVGSLPADLDQRTRVTAHLGFKIHSVPVKKPPIKPYTRGLDKVISAVAQLVLGTVE
jgi:hypothetical protein